MRILLLIFCSFLIYQSSAKKVFEGELIYHHDMKMNSENYSESRKHYDTLKITYKNKNYIKTKNKINFEKVLFIDSLKKRYVIYRDNSSKSKNLSMDEDNLNFGKLYNRENSHFGTIISLLKSDTVFNFKDQNYSLKKLFVERKYGNETYIFSESDSLKLTDNRNVLRNIGEQIHPTEIANVLNHSLIFYYKLNVKNTDLNEEYKLVDIQKKKIRDETFAIPKHKDAKGFKKENEKKGRFKFYVLID